MKRLLQFLLSGWRYWFILFPVLFFLLELNNIQLNPTPEIIGYYFTLTDWTYYVISGILTVVTGCVIRLIVRAPKYEEVK